MSRAELAPENEQWVLERVRAGADPDTVIGPLLEQGWGEQEAVDAVLALVQRHIAEESARHAFPSPVPVPVPIGTNAASVLDLGDRRVHVLVSLKLPRVVVLAGLLSDEECDALVELAAPRLRRSATVDNQTGGDQIHADRTSQGACYVRGANPLFERIEARIARLLDWPVENGEGLQVLRYGKGAQYKPHNDYFDPAEPGGQVLLQRGGQRVATVVMYLNTPEEGGATVFPDAFLEVAAVKGNAVFFSYDRPHAMTRTLHAGAPVKKGEKWIATKWLRESRHD